MIKFIKKLIVILIGVIFIGLGAAISIVNNWGSDPVTVFAQGLSNQFVIRNFSFFTVGNSLILTNLITFTILIIIYKMKYVKIGTFIGMFCVGFFIDLWCEFLENFYSGNGLINKTIMMIVGVVILSIGIGLYISSDMGASPVDLISVSLAEFLNKKYSMIRIICDMTFVVSGWILGGIVGISTIICMLFIGPISGIIIKYFKPFLFNDV